MVNVLDYVTFQDAYDHVPSGGGTIYVPPGIYTWDAGNGSTTHGQFRGLEITTTPVNLVGELGVSVIVPSSEHFTDQTAIKINRNGGCSIRNLFVSYDEDIEAGEGRAIQWYKPGNEALMAGVLLENVGVENSPNLAFEFTCDDYEENYVSLLAMIRCSASRAKSGGSVFLGGVGANNFYFEGCEFAGPGFGRFFNVTGCSVAAESAVVTDGDFGAVQVGDEVRGIGMQWGTTVESIEGAQPYYAQSGRDTDQIAHDPDVLPSHE